MASDGASLVALRELIADTDLTLETIPDLPQNRTAHCQENLRAALALADDLINQPYDAHVDSPVHSANQRLQQEVGEPLGRAISVLRLLQLLPDSLQYPRDSCHASRYHRSRVANLRTAGVGLKNRETRVAAFHNDRSTDSGRPDPFSCDPHVCILHASASSIFRQIVLT